MRQHPATPRSIVVHLDLVAHVATVLEIAEPARVPVVGPGNVPNPPGLLPGIPSVGQQAFGSALRAAHDFVAIPSAASRQSWNLRFDPDRVKGLYRQAVRERLAIDTRLNPPAV